MTIVNQTCTPRRIENSSQKSPTYISKLENWVHSPNIDEVERHERLTVQSLIIAAGNTGKNNSTLVLDNFKNLSQSPPFADWLKQIRIKNCGQLHHIEPLPNGLTKLWIENCPMLHCLPTSLVDLPTSRQKRILHIHLYDTNIPQEAIQKIQNSHRKREHSKTPIKFYTKKQPNIQTDTTPKTPTKPEENIQSYENTKINLHSNIDCFIKENTTSKDLKNIQEAIKFWQDEASSTSCFIRFLQEEVDNDPNSIVFDVTTLSLLPEQIETLLKFLNYLAKTRSYKNIKTRSNLAQAVMDLLFQLHSSQQKERNKIISLIESYTNNHPGLSCRQIIEKILSKVKDHPEEKPNSQKSSYQKLIDQLYLKFRENWR